MNRPPSDDATRVRRIYERRPYPAPRPSALTRPGSALAPAKWITAVSGMSPPRRILVAGCGTGREAFALRRTFPQAEIVAVDFSPRSVAVARGLQRADPAASGIRFLVADLTSRRLRAATGGDFDLTTCHGVLSYIPQPRPVLDNLRRCATPDGTLFLGVNGLRHHSSGLRAFLGHLGFDVAEMRDYAAARRALRLRDAVRSASGTDRYVNLPEELVAGDIFGPLIRNLPLDDWLRPAREAGWHFRASFYAQQNLRHLWQTEICQQLAPRSRAEVCLLADALTPASFHRLVLTRQPPANPPWMDGRALLDWKPAPTGLYSTRLPRRSAATWHKLTLRSVALNTRLDWRLPAWAVEILRRSDGQRSLREIIGPASVAPSALRRQIYLLYQLGVLNLTPPRP